MSSSLAEDPSQQFDSSHLHDEESWNNVEADHGTEQVVGDVPDRVLATEDSFEEQQPSPVTTPAKPPPPRFGSPNSTSLTPLKLALPPDKGFADVIRERTRQRILKEDAAVSQLTVQVSRLEAALSAETKRRIAAVQQINEKSVVAVKELEERLQKQLEHEMGRVHERLGGLEERVSSLEERWTDDVASLQDDIGATNKQLRSQLTAMQQNITTDRQQRTVRESQLKQQIEDLSTDFQERWKAERQDRISDLAALQETMDAVHGARQADVAAFERTLRSELSSLSTAVEREVQERHDHDQDIVGALNRYSKQLQDSLAAASGSVYY